jgi:hypothetical protein
MFWLGDLSVNVNIVHDSKQETDTTNNCNLSLTTTRTKTVMDKTATLIQEIMANLSAQLYHVKIIKPNYDLRILDPSDTDVSDGSRIRKSL